MNTNKMKFSLLDPGLPVYSFVDVVIVLPVCDAVVDTFHPLSCDVLSSIIRKISLCVISLFNKLLMSHLSSIIYISQHIVNLCVIF